MVGFLDIPPVSNLSLTQLIPKTPIIYIKKATGTNFLASILGKYKFKVEFLKDNQTMTSLEI